jgi:hypothetical protein
MLSFPAEAGAAEASSEKSSTILVFSRWHPGQHPCMLIQADHAVSYAPVSPLSRTFSRRIAVREMQRLPSGRYQHPRHRDHRCRAADCFESNTYAKVIVRASVRRALTNLCICSEHVPPASIIPDALEHMRNQGTGLASQHIRSATTIAAAGTGHQRLEG